MILCEVAFGYGDQTSRSNSHKLFLIGNCAWLVNILCSLTQSCLHFIGFFFPPNFLLLITLSPQQHNLRLPSRQSFLDLQSSIFDPVQSNFNHFHYRIQSSSTMKTFQSLIPAFGLLAVANAWYTNSSSEAVAYTTITTDIYTTVSLSSGTH